MNNSAETSIGLNRAMRCYEHNARTDWGGEN
jgi:hypothetical protein